MYVDQADYDGTTVTRGDTVSAVGSAYLIVALESFANGFAGTPLQADALDAISNQAQYMVAELSDGEGGYFDEATVGVGPSESRSLSSQAAAVRGLYVAARATGSKEIRAAADTAYGVLLSDYYVEQDQLFRSDAGNDEATYDARNFALLAGALREAALEGGAEEASNIYTGFFLAAGELMQLSEGGATGEVGGDSDADGVPFVPESGGLPPVFASHGVFTLNQ